jgi:hypothetical protein
MKKFIVNEEEKNRILNLHKKLISEQMTQIGNTKIGAASKYGAIQFFHSIIGDIATAALQ